MRELSEREAEVGKLMAAGKTNREIGEALGIAAGTVKIHVGNIFAKLDVQSREMAIAAIRERAE